MYIDYRSDVNYPTGDGSVIELRTNVNLEHARSSIVEAVGLVDGIQSVVVRHGLLPGTEMPSEVPNTLIVSKLGTRSWEGDLLPKIEALVMRCMFPSGGPQPPPAAHS